MKKAHKLTKPILVQNPYSNIDVLYGPYGNMAEALNTILPGVREQGLTFGIINSTTGKVEEYWWNTSNTSVNPVKKVAEDLYGPYSSIEAAMSATEGQRKQGTTVGVIVGNKIKEYQWMSSDMSDNPVEKIEELNLTISTVGNTTMTVLEGDYITLNFSVEGRSIISKGYLYLYINGQEIFISELPNVTKGTNAVQVTPPAQSGVYAYRIKITDTAGYNAKTADGEREYIQYEVKYGGISVTVNTTNFDRIQIKNIKSLAEQYFTLNISVRDDSFRINGVYFSDGGTNNINLQPYKSLTELNSTYIGFNYYILPQESALTNFDGKMCYIKVMYTENGVSQTWTKELFTLLKTDSLEVISQSVLKSYYINFPDYFTFQLKSGVQNLSVYISQDDDSDFTFEPVTVSAYNNFSLRVIPANITASAQLKIVCNYIVSGREVERKFEIPMGEIKPLPEKAYYEPSSTGTVSLDKSVNAQEGDLVDGTSYYKILNDFVSDEYNTCAFIADIYCKINQVNNKNLKYIRILQGTNEIGYVTEDIINCRGIITDTPLNEWTQISFGYNIEESVIRGNNTNTAQYFAIYINGMIVKNIQIDGVLVAPLSYNSQAPITIELNNGINVQKCYVYYKNNGQQYISPKADVYSIVYTNYLANNPEFEEPGDLPVLKLMRITDQSERQYYFDLIKEQNEDLRHLTTFGTIGLEKAIGENGMAIYDSQYKNDQMDHDNATLFRQSVDIKKPAQKEYAVLCKGKWEVNGRNLLEGCIIEAHTQGTSTLVYPVPNFKFTFWKVGDNGLEHFYPDFIEKGDGEYYNEYVYTAKADYMDSSHLNNTPTCNFYNNLIQGLIENDTNFSTFDGSPSARNGGIDAIMGFPIVLEISDNATNIDDTFINIGSFMLNVDKTGNSLNFEVNDDGQSLSCISFEGTSNDNEHGAAGRFTKDDDLEYYENEDEITSSAQEITTALASANKKLSLDATVGGVKVRNHKYVKWCKFLSDGLEYRYPDSDIYKTNDNNQLTKIMKVGDFKKLYKMWEWVSKSDEYDPADYRSEFVQHFDLNYCMLYFIQLMIFAQTDNLGKNAMFDCWDGEHWYPRPYDLDSQAGLDNNGNDNIAPFVEIKPEFSLNYNPEYTHQQLEDNFLLESSKIPYGGQDLDRYHFSSNASKLWINFYKNFKSQIEAFYSNLRNNGNYTPNAIIELCEDSLIDKLGINQYNQDFTNKYLATTSQELAYGNRWYKFKKWITQRFAFCDSYFHAAEPAQYNLVSSITYEMEVESPQYITQTYQDQSIVKFVIDKAIFSAGSSAATKITLQVNLSQVLNTELFKYVSYGGIGPRSYRGIITLDVSGNRQINGIEGLVGVNLPNLKELNISNSTVSTLSNIPMQLKKLTAENVQLNSIEFPTGCLVEEISLKGSTITSNVNFSMLPNLKKLDLTNCTFTGSITLSNLTALETFIINGAVFKSSVIIQNGVNIDDFDFSNISLSSVVFDGNDINIKKLNFRNTIFSQDTINLNAVSGNLEEIYFNGCQNLKHLEMTPGVTFAKINTFSIYSSSVESLGSVIGEFDASKFSNISSLKRVSSFASDGTPYYTQFTFYATKVPKIVNLNWNGTGENLFRECYSLTSIAGSMTLTENINYLFFKCTSLTTIPTIIIDNSDNKVTSAQYSFCSANLLGYSKIENILKNCNNVTNFYSCCWGTKLADNTDVKLDTIFGTNTVVTNVGRMFGAGGFNTGIDSVSNKLKFSGKIPSTVKDSNMMFYGITTASVPYDILQNAASLEVADGTFCNCGVTFYIPSGSSAVLPSYTATVDDGQGGTTEQVTYLDNAIDNTFFYRTGENKIRLMRGLFQNTNVQIIDTNVFSGLTNLEDCQSCFYSSSPRKFLKELSINTLWSNNSKLKTVAGCFNNVYNITCSGQLVFHSGVTSINISGLFSLSSAVNDSSTITINIGAIVPEITTDNYYSTIGNTTTYYGVFENRKVHILDSSSTILSKLNSNCRRMFCGSSLYMNTSVTTINLSNVKDCRYMFSGCSAYKYNDNEIYNDDNRIFFAFTMPNSNSGCRYYQYMFSGSKILSELPRLLSNLSEDLSSMFRDCVINVGQVVIPHDYFSICKNSLISTNAMFYANKYITELEYSSDGGLFEGCIKLNNVQDMFNGCYFLHKGIPNNMFGVTPLLNLTSLKNLFRETYILYDIEDESVSNQKKWMDANTIAPLEKLQSIEGMFERCRPGNSDTGYGSYRDQITNIENVPTYVINPNTFANIKLQSIMYLFKQTSNVQNIPFKFLGFEYANDAFYDSRIRIIDQNFVSDVYISDVKNVSGMFYELSSVTNHKTVENLGTFINRLKESSTANMANVAGNLANEDIDTSLKQTRTGEQVYTGISAINKRLYTV